MELQTWKQLPSDNFTCVQVPSFKMMEIIKLNGGKQVGTVEGKGLFFYIAAVPDDKMDSTFSIIRDLRIKGMVFDGVGDETT